MNFAGILANSNIVFDFVPKFYYDYSMISGAYETYFESNYAFIFRINFGTILKRNYATNSKKLRDSHSFWSSQSVNLFADPCKNDSLLQCVIRSEESINNNKLL